MLSPKSDFKFEKSLNNINKKDWDLCLNDDHPFTQYEYLSALEKSNSACNETGWQPHHYIEYKNNKVVAICPLYIKNHSFGEYIFDHAWAEAYHRYGLNYYPKLQSAIPFTPVTGERILISQSIKDKNKTKSTAIVNIIEEVKKINVSSLHFNFIKSPDEWAKKNNLMIREGIQFHWMNNNYKSFNNFLETLSSRKRKQIKKERLSIKNNNLVIKIFQGEDIKEEHMSFFYDCYLDTTSRKWGSTYLTKDFFFEILKTLNNKIVLIIAFQNRKKIASAINFVSNSHLYGRLWGSKYEIPYLHFELCYYQAIDYAIKNNINIVEAGAQGEHKLQRGYMPKKIWSAHWIKDQKFSRAIEKFLNDETNIINKYKKNLEDFAPYKN
ncbi:MAG: hypothetical protein CFH15_00500 [Alphaproteobacteria bacterium MarineAlpha5_Bin5]|nr:MAG: hypothetical protein CFH15_00500 [Alphaproteobacteria bacterium MarineAlpha5_Bin5]PPR50664.1 MAG: hypothetical protein CFH14_00841 [Alphaproteobacteria bacterium MarineAlpha5_Bin4]|tara:strand:+ start:4307 stop:5452 length:1146 start_codon:yes stop_codon:yes gene_type:complete